MDDGVAWITERCSVGLPALMGLEFVEVGRGRVRARMRVRPELLAPNGFLHAASVVALADTSCGAGTIAALRESGASFTTIELKSNFLGTARDGVIECVAEALHLGRTTQVWDAEVTLAEGGRRIAVFRCTQMVLPAARDD
ncbi:MAG: PaaI family thioesterase [Ectothiorhodospiraceae bacterium]|nr:PaaI family thioesterase [Chromatiales bacterium]MCP5154713.1 PaaI family thioesterase [Ectothiorhodospiraceae bacterium]